MANFDIVTDADLINFAATYQWGDVGRLLSTDYDINQDVIYQRGQFSLVNAAGADVRINCNSYGFQVPSAGIHSIDGDPTGQGFRIRISRTAALADRHNLHFNAGNLLVTATVKAVVGVGNPAMLAEKRSVFRCDAGFGDCNVEFIDCDASDASNDGFSSDVTQTTGSCNATLTTCSARDCADECFSPHAHSEMRVVGGYFYSDTQHVGALGVGTANEQRCKLYIDGATLIGNGCSAVIGVSTNNDVFIGDRCNLQIQSSGVMFIWASNATIAVDGKSHLDVQDGCFMWDNIDALSNTSFLCADARIHVPSLSAASVHNVFMDRAVPVVNIVGTRWEMAGSSIANLITYPDAGQQWSITCCDMVGGDFPGGPYNGPVFNSMNGILEFDLNFCSLTGWKTHTLAHYRGYCGSTVSTGTFKANGNTFFGLPNQTAGTFRRTVISLIAGTVNCEINHNTIFNDNDEASPLSYAIYYAPDISPRGNIVSGNWNCGLREDGAGVYSGSYNWITGTFVLGAFFIPSGSLHASDISGGAAPLFHGGASPTTRRGFALAAAEAVQLDVPFAARVQQPWALDVSVRPSGVASLTFTPDTDARIDNLSPDLVPIPDGETGINRGAVAHLTKGSVAIEVTDIAAGNEFTRWSQPGLTGNPLTITRDQDWSFEAVVGPPSGYQVYVAIDRDPDPSVDTPIAVVDADTHEAEFDIAPPGDGQAHEVKGIVVPINEVGIASQQSPWSFRFDAAGDVESRPSPVTRLRATPLVGGYARVSWQYEEPELIYKATDFEVAWVLRFDSGATIAGLEVVVAYEPSRRDYAVTLGPAATAWLDVSVAARNADGGYVTPLPSVSCRLDAEAPAETALAMGVI